MGAIHGALMRDGRVKWLGFQGIPVWPTVEKVSDKCGEGFKGN